MLQPPGTYTVTLRVGEDEYSQTLKARRDPHSAGTEEDIRVQTEMLLDVHEDMSAAAEAINRIEWVRRQLEDLQSVAKGVGVEAEAIISNAGELVGTFVTLQGKMLQLRATGTGQDVARWPVMLAGKLSYLAGAVSTVTSLRPTKHREVHQELKAELAEYQKELEGLLHNELPAFNQTLDENQLPRIVGLRLAVTLSFLAGDGIRYSPGSRARSVRASSRRSSRWLSTMSRTTSRSTAS